MLPWAWNGLYNWTCSMYLCCQEEKVVTEDEIVGWHQWLDGYEFEQTLGDGEGQGRLVCYSPWGCKESDTIEKLNNNNVCSQEDGRRVAELTTDGQAEEQLTSWAFTRLASLQPLGPQHMGHPPRGFQARWEHHWFPGLQWDVHLPGLRMQWCKVEPVLCWPFWG